MEHLDPLASLSDAELFATVQRLTARSNVALADLLAHLGEVEARGIHRTRACASLYTYCIYELRMSEDAAYRRAKAARLVREYPELREAIARGELHLTGVLMIGPHLGGEHHAEILRRVRFRSKREILRIVAELDPRPDVPALVSPLGPELPGPVGHRTFVEALSGPYRELPFGQRPEDWMEGNDDRAVTGADAATSDAAATDDIADARKSPRPLRYRVQFTASQEFVDLLSEVSDLLGHECPRPSLPDVQLRALRALAKDLKRRKRAATDRPRSGRAPGDGEAGTRDGDGASGTAPERVVHADGNTGAAPERVIPVDGPTEPAPGQLAPPSSRGAPARSDSRHIPAPSRRVVWKRDRARCAYVDDRGERCRETCGLEIHHCQAHALGGPPTPSNLELRCRAHNALAAEEDFGREHMDRMRGAARSSHMPSILRGARRHPHLV